jgi:hypothetical protein
MGIYCCLLDPQTNSYQAEVADRGCIVGQPEGILLIVSANGAKPSHSAVLSRGGKRKIRRAAFAWTAGRLSYAGSCSLPLDP